jgi:hypothetical protein
VTVEVANVALLIVVLHPVLLKKRTTSLCVPTLKSVAVNVNVPCELVLPDVLVVTQAVAPVGGVALLAPKVKDMLCTLVLCVFGPYETVKACVEPAGPEAVSGFAVTLVTAADATAGTAAMTAMTAARPDRSGPIRQK